MTHGKERLPGVDGKSKGSVREFSGRLAKRALAPVVASAATAGTAFLIRKATELWHEKVEPKVQEKGGGRAVAGEALEKAKRVGSEGAQPLKAVAERLGEAAPQRPSQGGEDEASEASDNRREEQRKQREQRRRERKRALEQSGSS